MHNATMQPPNVVSPPLGDCRGFWGGRPYVSGVTLQVTINFRNVAERCYKKQEDTQQKLLSYHTKPTDDVLQNPISAAA